MDETMNCPLSWCDGRLIDHGGDGQGPESWVHYGMPIELMPVELPESRASLARIQYGGELAEWTGHVELGGGAFESGLSEVVTALRGIADAIERTRDSK